MTVSCCKTLFCCAIVTQVDGILGWINTAVLKCHLEGNFEHLKLYKNLKICISYSVCGAFGNRKL